MGKLISFSGHLVVDMPSFDDYCNLPITPLPDEGGYRLTSVIGGSCHKFHFCCDKSFVPTNLLLL